ncbi:MAG: DUF4384 domain-containing protein [Ignavibacteria bacterium]
MKKTFAARVAALLVAASFAVHGFAQGPAAEPNGDDEMKPRFIWGVLLNIALKYALSAFGNYLLGKLTEQITPDTIISMLERSKTAKITPLAHLAPREYAAREAGAAENAVAGVPAKPLTLENGRENYQAVHVALMNFDRAGNPQGFHPVTQGFATGERFKLRVLPTFDGILVIDNINPRNERRQIYPPQSDNVVAIKAGVEIVIPLDRDQYFEFTGDAGDEQLVVTVRDPRAFGAAASAAPVTRKDENNGSNFMQEVSPDTYPVISQSLHLGHQAGRP